jgi:hypothetical protein
MGRQRSGMWTRRNSITSERFHGGKRCIYGQGRAMKCNLSDSTSHGTVSKSQRLLTGNISVSSVSVQGDWFRRNDIAWQ